MVINLSAWAKTIMGDSRLNRCTNIFNTGTYLSALDKAKFGILGCTEDGGDLNLIKDHIYVCNAAGDAVIDLSALVAHTHTAASGGDIVDINIANPEKIDLLMVANSFFQKANWIEAVTGTGSIEDHTDAAGQRAIRLRPNGTSGSGSTVRYPAQAAVDFSKNSMCIYVVQFETASSLAFHGGVNADDVTAADSNTRKYNSEVCTVTNNNWFLRTADGTANSSSDTGTAFSTNKVGHKMIHLPTAGTPEVSLSLDGDTAFQKTSNIPIDQNSANSNIIKMSVKNSIGQDRPAKFYGGRMTFTTSATWGY